MSGYPDIHHPYFCCKIHSIARIFSLIGGIMNALSICTDREDAVRNYHTAVNVLHIVDDVFPQLQEECDYVCKLLQRYEDSQWLQYLRKNYPETKFIESHYSGEAWKITEAIGKMLTRLKNFFIRVFQSIKVFVVIRIGAAETVIAKWAEYCDKRKNDVEMYLKSIDKKDMPADLLTELLMKSLAVYKGFQELLNKVASLTVESVVSANNAENLVDDPPEFKEWEELMQKVEDANPRNKETNGKAAMTPMDGKWGDAVEILRLRKSVSQAKVVLKDLKRMETNVNKIMDDLKDESNEKPIEKTDNNNGKMKVATEDVFKRRKLAFLRTKVSKTMLTVVIGALTRYVSFCGSQCEEFIKAMDKTSQKAAQTKA